jgi:predicted  nucleic acid-binding Zn-ribbon protein
MSHSALRILLRLRVLDARLRELEQAETRARRQWTVLSQRKEFLEELVAEERRRPASAPSEPQPDSHGSPSRARLAALQAELSAFDAAVERFDKQADDQVGNPERARLAEERLAVLAELPAAVGLEYEALQRAGRHPALAEIESGYCSGCHLRLPAQLASRARQTGELVRCPHCQRLLHDPRCLGATDG